MKTEGTLNPAHLEQQIKSFIKNKDALIAVALQDVEQKFYLGINDTISLHAASTMKVPVMMEIFRQADQGKFKMDDSLLIKNEFKSIVDGSSYSLDISEDGGDRLYSMIGSKESVRALVNEMIVYSGNLATNLLIELADAGNVQHFMESIGANDIRVLRGVEDIKAYRAGKNNTTTANDLAIIYQAIYNGSYWSDQSRAKMLDILLRQHYHSKIPAQLPAQVKVAHKTGSITRIDHDSGIIFPQGYVPYILVVLTRGFEDHTKARETIARISRMVYDWYISR
jgi:beta-lactamase class A